MGPKLELATTPVHTLQELAPIVQEFCTSPLVASKRLMGGYSGSNYRIDLKDGCRYVLKITDGYSPQAAEKMCQTTHALTTSSTSTSGDKFDSCCVPLPKLSYNNNNSDNDDEYQFVSLKEPRTKAPAFILTWVEGRQADQVIRDSPALATTVLAGIGQGLARMHLAVSFAGPNDIPTKLRWYPIDGGCCDVQDHVLNKTWNKITSEPNLQQHPFLSFYRTELQYLQQQLSVTGFDGTQPLALGIIHGDPFADNVLVNPDTGALAAFVDIEDVCVGPLLFDLACCTIGSCFSDEATNCSLNMEFLAALWRGYFCERSLPTRERDYLIPYLRVTLLCNCAWRFCKFHIDTTEGDVPQEAKDSYLELQHRIEYLQKESVVQGIQTILDRL